MATGGWELWRLDRIDDGNVRWLAVTRPEARATVDKQKVWTLVPDRRLFIANWFVTEDHRRCEGDQAIWIHENIDIDEAREVALTVPDVSSDEMARLTRPERCLTLDQLDRHPVDKILGVRVARALSRRG